jgi:8-oxo-dGTP pyrophosphatase MutT (NUDIX family)
MWKVLDNQPILNSPWLRVDRQTVETERGDVIPDYYVANKSSFIMVLAITEAGDIILLREYKHGVGDYVWNLPAGGIKPGESPEETATRELLEETGYITDALEFVGSYAVSSSWLQDRAYLFIGRNARQVRVPRIEPGESITVFFKSMREILEMVRVNQIQDPYTVLLILYANRQWGVGE